MSESELLASPDFLAWCAVWEEERHCPLPFADWCLENVGELAFEACVWAHKRTGGGLYGGGTFGPDKEPNGDWYFLSLESGEMYSCDAPFPLRCNLPSFPAAIAYYLTHFDREIAKRYPPKVRTAVPA